MKKRLLTIFTLLALVSSVNAEESVDIIRKGIDFYKQTNYTSAMQVLKKAVYENPGSALAHYYLGMTYVRVGELDSASDAYNKAILLDPDSQIAEYARIGKQLLNEEVGLNNKQEFSPGDFIIKDFLSDKVKDDMRNRNLEYLIDNINKGQPIDHNEIEKFEKFRPNSRSDSGMPSSEEIAEAMKVLQRAGINTYNSQVAANPEIMKMNMMMGAMGGNDMQQNNNPMAMLPVLMMMQGQNGGQVDPGLVQTMLTNTMMPDLSGFYGNNNNNY